MSLAFAFTLARLFTFFRYSVRPHRFGHQRRGNGSHANETPSLVRIFDKLPDDQGSEKSGCFDPMTGCPE